MRHPASGSKVMQSYFAEAILSLSAGPWIIHPGYAA
jgi:hypothetical protein